MDTLIVSTMLNENITLKMYQGYHDQSESYEQFQHRIYQGLEIAKRESEQNKKTYLSDEERKNLNLALKYNLLVIDALLEK
jgi:hypothetical protein